LWTIGCVNVANLQLVRSARRTRERPIRASLSAARGQLLTSLVVKSVLLSLVAAMRRTGRPSPAGLAHDGRDPAMVALCLRRRVGWTVTTGRCTLRTR
jgi:hypothetical protein